MKIVGHRAFNDMVKHVAKTSPFPEWVIAQHCAQLLTWLFTKLDEGESLTLPFGRVHYRTRLHQVRYNVVRHTLDRYLNKPTIVITLKDDWSQELESVLTKWMSHSPNR